MKHSLSAAVSACILGIFAGCSVNGLATSSFSDSFTEKLSDDYSGTVTIAACVEYPESGFSKKGLQNVRCKIKEAVYGKEYAGMDIQDGFDMYSDNLLKEYRETSLPAVEEFVRETGEAPAGMDWEYSIDARFSGTAIGTVSYTVTKYEYTGGAHGLQTTTAYLFDSRSGEIVSEEDIFAKGYGPELSSLLTAHAADGYENPEDLVLFVDNIEPNGNFYADADGITYIYNPYEIAPYSSDTITITVPWKELEGLLKK